MREIPVLLPVPRQLVWGGSTVTLPEELWIVSGAHHDQLLPSLQRFQSWVTERTGLSVRLSASPVGLTERFHIAVRVDPTAGHPQEGYELVAEPEGIRLTATSPVGAAYGLVTLKQLLATGRQFPSVRIQDAPDFGRRGVMLDVSRGKVPTMASLYQFVDLLADLKVNELQLYTEHTFAYKNHQEVWQAYSPMTGEEILQLDRYCRERFIDLVPNQNSFGHMTPWLSRPRYQHMAETLDGWDTPWGDRRPEPFSLTPDEPAVIPFLAELYDELLPHFSSRYFNVGCDETFDLGQGRSKAAVAERGEHWVYLDQLLKIHKMVSERGRTMQFWGDIIIKAPEAVQALPKDIVALEWGYEENHPFDERGAEYAKAGVPFYVCPGTSTWMSLVGRTQNALGNIASAAKHGLKHGAIGLLNTIWGDWGHQDYEPVTYLPIAYGAAVSWSYEANQEADCLPYLNRILFQDKAEAIGQLLYDLGNTYLTANVTQYNNTPLGLLFHRAAKWRQWANLPKLNFDEQEAAIRKAAEGLERVRLAHQQGPLILRELRTSVQLLLLLCDLGRTLQAVLRAEAAEQSVAGPTEAQTETDQVGATVTAERPTAAELERLALAFEAYGYQHRELWLQRNRHGGLEEMSMEPIYRWQTTLRALAKEAQA